jgi:exonuclease VII small subunit
VSDGCRFPTLADEISTIKEALDGAPVHAKEAVLKILERLTQRVDRAERDRDLAVGRYREMQARYDQLEEELAKKRAELRELLRQESGGGGRYRERDLIVKREMERMSSAASAAAAASDMDDAVVVVVEANNGPEDRGSDREVDRLSERSGGSVSRLENYSLASGLPKIELKSPARVMQEEEEAVGGAERPGGPRAASRAEPDKTKATSKQVRIWLTFI